MFLLIQTLFFLQLFLALKPNTVVNYLQLLTVYFKTYQEEDHESFNSLGAPFNFMVSGINPVRTTVVSGGRGWFNPPPFNSSNNWYVEYCICTYATINFFLKRPQNLTFFPRCQNQNINFEYFPKIPSEKNSSCPFLIPTIHMRKYLLHRGSQRIPGGPKNL